MRGIKFHAMRSLRLRIKSGFVKEEPIDYVFMKRYPPLHRNDGHNYHKLKPTEVPYVDLYEKAVQRNPLYDDERVYPAYWNQEPQALTLAKKQYEHMQSGLDEETAYQKAIAFINEIENESFLEMEKVSEAFSKMKAKAPFMTVPSIAAEISKWREALIGKSFLDLELADQGEIDYLLQVKILQWNEVERERRMKDPVFEIQFSKFRESIFPLDATLAVIAEKEKSAYERTLYMDLYELDPEKLTYKEPFFVEDYIMHFERVRNEPDLRKWSSDNRASLSRWLVDSLALQFIVDTWDNDRVQEYLNKLRVHFFPMIHFPDRALDFAVPSVSSIKQMLYDNDIGYKTVDGKLFVRRAYRLPMLLFPQETLAASLLEEEADRNREHDEESDLSFTGGDEMTAQQIREKTQRSSHKFGDDDRNDSSMDILNSLFEDSFHVDDSVASNSNASRLAGLRERGESSMSAEQLAIDEKELADKKRNSNKSLRREDMSTDDWQLIKNKYYTVPVTELERQREELIRGSINYKVDDQEDELDLSSFRDQRMQLQIITRARLNLKYEQKEAARRSREWTARGVWIDGKMPKPSLHIEKRTKQ